MTARTGAFPRRCSSTAVGVYSPCEPVRREDREQTPNDDEHDDEHDDDDDGKPCEHLTRTDSDRPNDHAAGVTADG